MPKVGGNKWQSEANGFITEIRSGILARPERATPLFPGVIVIQQAWGVNEETGSITMQHDDNDLVASV